MNNFAEFERQVTFCDICLDFDGVIHSYISGWKGIDVILDPIVETAIESIYQYLAAGLSVAVHSTRSSEEIGRQAIKDYIRKHDPDDCLVDQLLFPIYKPAARIYIDDRGYRFTGTFPTPDEIIANLTVWNKDEV